MSRMDDDLFTYEVEISGLANVPCDLNEKDDSEQQMTHGTGDDMEYDPSNIEFTEWTFKEFNYLLQIDLDFLADDFDAFKTYEKYKDDSIYEWNKDIPWVHEKPWTDNGKDDGYCNGGNLPGAYIIGNTLRYQDLEWCEALEDGKLKDKALKNKME
ncbi:hypothetical protein Tco_0116254 [Tanacetum coccineum]